MYEAIFIPSTHVPIDTRIFLSLVLSSMLAYLTIAILAIIHGTCTLRLALWPVAALLAWRAAVTVDMSAGDPKRKLFNSMFVFLMIYIVTRAWNWLSSEAPLTRYMYPSKSSRSIIMDGLDLALNLRGHGWDWSRTVRIPRETRPSSREGFTIHVIMSAIAHTFLHAVAREVIVSFSPMGIGALSGGSIFDETLPFHMRYFRASVITAVASLGAYSLVQSIYDTCTIIGVLVFGQDPAQWPPAFNSPWNATSVSDFWSRRWHQFFRRLFLVQGGYPLSFFLGRAGLVIVSFLSSAMMHHIPLVQLNPNLEPWRMLVGFGMMGLVVLVEEAFTHVTGRKVGGCMGWVWTMTWLLVGVSIHIDGFARAGLYGYLNFAEGMIPGRVIVRRTVASFDRWLHAM